MKRTRTRKSGYTKVGDYVEVRVPRRARYTEVVQSAALAVGLNEESSSEEELLATSQGELSLFRSEGTRVPDSPLDLSTLTPWTVHEYMNSFPSYRRTGIAVKLGVGYIPSVSFWNHVAPPCKSLL